MATTTSNTLNSGSKQRRSKRDKNAIKPAKLDDVIKNDTSKTTEEDKPCCSKQIENDLSGCSSTSALSKSRQNPTLQLAEPVTVSYFIFSIAFLIKHNSV